jgi:carboxymethylenebutenolidase
MSAPNAGSVSSIRFRGHGGDEIDGITARPKLDEDKLPGIVLVQEAFGIDAHIRSMVARFADEGFVVIAPDLYSREGTPGPKPTRQDPEPMWSMDDVRAAVSSLPDRRVLADLEGALVHLANDPSVDAKRLGAVGFCMGGNYAYLLGCKSMRVRAVVDFYGRFVYRELTANKPVQPLEMALNLSCPLLAIFGGQDPSISRADVEKLRTTLDQFGKELTIVTFPGAGHGFLNDRRKSYDADAAAKAWKLAIDFLREHLAS